MVHVIVNGTWSAWRESVVSGMNQDECLMERIRSPVWWRNFSFGGAGNLNGNLGVGGGATSKMPSSDGDRNWSRPIVREGGER